MSSDSRPAAGDELDGLSADEWFSAEPVDDGPEDSSVRRVRLSTTDPYESNQLLQRELQRRRHVVEQLRILASAVSASCDGVAILTPEITGPRIAYVNRGFCDITGRKPAETSLCGPNRLMARANRRTNTMVTGAAEITIFGRSEAG